ncbi:MAG: helix-turn-helix domain-containing protein [Pseudomonadota bacterium]
MKVISQIPQFVLFGETSDLPDIVHIERIAARASAHDWRIAAHRHPDMAQLIWVESGRAEARADGQHIVLTGNDFVFIPAQSVHSFVFERDTEGAVCSFPQALSRTIGPARDTVLSALERPVHGRRTSALSTLTELLAQRLADPGGFRTEAAVALSHACLAQIADIGRASGTAPARPPLMARLDTLVEGKLGAGWKVADFAKALAVSPGHLSRACRAATGGGAKAYIEDKTLSEASRLLAFTQLPVSEVGFRLGFEDPSYFSKRFRAALGLTPSAYRQKFVRRDAGQGA